jgi:hypothetical protein
VVDPTDPNPTQPFLNVSACVIFDGNLTVDYENKTVPKVPVTIPIAKYSCAEGEFGSITVKSKGADICNSDDISPLYEPTEASVLVYLDRCTGTGLEMPNSGDFSALPLQNVLYIVAMILLLLV